MSGWVIAVIIMGVMLPVDFLVLRTLVGGAFDGIAKKYPAQPVLAGAVRREFQSISIGLSNMGGCVHMSVDERCWHIEPARFVRWLGGRSTISIPWEAIRVKKATPRAVTVHVERIGEVRGPVWALGLAGGADSQHS